MHLKRTQQIVGVDFFHADRVFPDRQDGDRLLFLVNHPTRADAAIFLETLRRLRMRCQMMAAYDVFLRSRITRFVMQRMAVFSRGQAALGKAWVSSPVPAAAVELRLSARRTPRRMSQTWEPPR